MTSKHKFLASLKQITMYMIVWRRGGLMVSALVPGSSSPGSRPGQGHCVVFLGKTLNSHSASHPTNCGEVTCDGLASRPGGVEILLAASCYRNRDNLRQLWASLTPRLHYMIVPLKLRPTCESNNLFAFLTLSWLPFKRLLDPGGKCRYMSDKQGSINTARRQPQTIMVLMTCSDTQKAKHLRCFKVQSSKQTNENKTD